MTTSNRIASHHAGVPLVPVVRSRSGRDLIVHRCPYCNSKHFHGDGGEHEPALHHRLTHCLNPPSLGADYILAEVRVARPPFVPPFLMVDL